MRCNYCLPLLLALFASKSVGVTTTITNANDEEKQRDLRFGSTAGNPLSNLLRAPRAQDVPAPSPADAAKNNTTNTTNTTTVTDETPEPAPKTNTTNTTNTTTAATEDDDIMSNATVTLDPRFQWGKFGVAENLITGNTNYTDFMKHPSTSLGHCVHNLDFAPWVQIDLGSPKLLYGITLWHYWGDKRHYCSQYLKVSTDMENWTIVFETGANFGAIEVAEGHYVGFDAQLVRYIRHGAGPSNINNAVHFLQIQVDGVVATSPEEDEGDDEHKVPLKLVASPTGQDLVATQNGKTFRYDMEEEEWEEVAKDTGFQQVALHQGKLVVGVNSLGQIYVPSSSSKGEWKLLGEGVVKEEIAYTEDRIWAINKEGDVSYYKDDKWTNEAAGTKYSQIATNHKGDYLVALTEDGKVFVRKTTDQQWLERKDLPAKFVHVAIGGSHEVWLITEEGQVYHAWIQPEATKLLHDWEKVDNKLRQIAATSSGAIWGVSIDGMGILYCPNRKPKRHGFRCQYVIGPLGAVAQSLLTNQTSVARA